MIRQLRVQNFRKHSDIKVLFDERPNVIIGPNGSGKTSLVEAIYIALQGKSWRSNFLDILNINRGEDWWRIDIEFDDGEKRTVKYDGISKTFQINNDQYSRLPQKYKKPTILFEPGDLQLIYGSPARRRDFIDRLISQIEPKHQANLNKMERILKQRNNLLKNQPTQDELFVWNVQFADVAEKIIEYRQDWIKQINGGFSDSYQAIANDNTEVTVKYDPAIKHKSQIIRSLHNEFVEGLQYTRVGPQSHDILFYIDNKLAKTAASRGESRTIVISLVSAAARLVNDQLGMPAYLILDDFDGELDEQRAIAVRGSGLYGDNIVFATAVDTPDSANNIHLTKLK